MEELEKIIISEKEAGLRLDICLSNIFKNNLTRSYIKTLIDNEKILVNKKKIKAGYVLKINDEVNINLPETQPADILPEKIKLDIVYEDEYLAVINKPQNMIVHPAGKVKSNTLVNALMYHFKNLSTINGEFRPGIVHRLDKDTSGLIVVAKNDFSHLELQKQIQTKICHRIYMAVCYGKFNNDSGTIETYLNRGKSQHEKIFVVPNGQGRLAITNYKVLKYANGFSLVEFELKTGRTHQIRVHSSYLNHPIVGDKLYGKKFEKFGLSGQLLHAKKISFIHPKTKEYLEFVSPLPNYFQEFLSLHSLN